MRPPRVFERLIAASLPTRDRDVVLGDLREEFESLCASSGRPAARRWYRRQVIRSLMPNMTRRLTTDAPRPEPNALPTGVTMDSLWQDLRFAWRTLVRRPVVSMVAVLSLTLGIAAATIVYSLLDAAVLRALPVSAPDELALVLEQRDTSVNHNFTYLDYTDFRAGAHAFTDLFAYESVSATLREPGGSRVVPGEIVSGGYFSTLGIRLTSGRGLVDADGRPGGQPAVVVSETLARRVSGGTVILNGAEFAIVGIAASPFQGMQIGREAQFWAPLEYQPVLDPDGGRSYLTSTGVSWLSIMGRLRHGTTVEQAMGDLNHLEATLPRAPNRPQTRRLTVATGSQGDSGLPTAMASPLRLLLAAAGFVLLIACANVANLMVARTTERTREIAIRTALGAGRGRIARLLVAETLLVSAGSAAIALLVSHWTARLALPLMATFGSAPALDVGVNWRVVAFSGTLGLAATLVAAAVPIAGVLRRAPSRSLDAGRPGTAAPSANRLRRGLVIAQFTLSLALVVSATLLVRTLINLRAIPTGFDIDHVALLSVDPAKAQYDAPRIRQYLDAAIARLAAIPGVRAAGYGRVIPIGFGGSRSTIDVIGYQPAPNEDMEINFNVISPSYFAATGITLADGRALTDADTLGRPLVAIVNETMARHFWPGGSAIGRQFHFGGETGPLFEVVGIAHDVKYRMLREDAAPSFYYSVAQSQTPRGGVLHVRVAGDPEGMLATLRRTAAAVDPLVPVTSARTLRAQVDLNVNDERMAMTIGVSLGGAALLLAAVGLYGAMAYLVGQRTREIGVRMALGANPADMQRLMLKQGVRLAIVGSAVGIALALVCGRLIESRLYRVHAYDPISIVASIALLSAVAIFASWAPARRAASIDPVIALRVD